VESKTTLRFLTFVLSKALKHLAFLLSWLPDSTLCIKHLLLLPSSCFPGFQIMYKKRAA
jgi:hypothetical protein